MSDYFAELKPSGGRVKVELDLSNYAKKSGSKIQQVLNTSRFTRKVDLATSKSDIDKLNIDKLKNIPTNLNNLKIKVDKLDVDKLVPALVDLKNYVM